MFCTTQYIACMIAVFTADDLISGALHVGRQVVRKDDVAEREVLVSNAERQRVISLAKKKTCKWELAK